jgi:hypothetical protein
MVAWSSGIEETGAMGLEIESHQGICRAVAFIQKKTLGVV